MSDMCYFCRREPVEQECPECKRGVCIQCSDCHNCYPREGKPDREDYVTYGTPAKKQKP